MDRPGTRIEAALWHDAWRRFRRGSGNPLTLLMAGAALWAADYLGRRSAAGVSAALGPRVDALPALAVALLALLTLAQAWRRCFGRPRESAFLLGQPVAPRHLRRLWLAQLLGSALLPAGLLAVALRHTAPAPHAWALPLAALPACVAAGLAGCQLLAPLPVLARSLVVALTTVALAAGALASPAPHPMAWAAALVAALPLLVIATRLFDGYRARLAGCRHADAGPIRAGRAPLRRLLSPLPRRVRALVLADLRFVARGGHLNGLALTPLLLALPAAYLVWPLPDNVAQAKPCWPIAGT